MKALNGMKNFVLLMVTTLACVGCEQQTGNYIPDIKIYVFYETAEDPGLQKPDAGARICYYCGIRPDDLAGYTYQEGGVFVKDNSIIEPDARYLIGQDGSVAFIPEDKGGGATVVVESEYYKGRIKTIYFSSPQDGAGFHTIFRSDEI